MLRKLVPRFLALVMIFSCCGAQEPQEPAGEPNSIPPKTQITATIRSTNTAVPAAINTPEPTYTPMPTGTAQPSQTPKPTDSPTPTETPAAERTEFRVVEVVDGDTIKVEIQGELFTVRYIGIDAPEPVEWMGPEATAANGRLVEGKVVVLEEDVSETDQYGRLLRYVYVGSLQVNYELVRLGSAQVSTYPPDVKYAELFLEAQQEAMEAGHGLWAPTPAPSPIPPSPTQAPTPTRIPTATATQPAPTQPPPTPSPVPPPTEPPPTATDPPAAPGVVVISHIYYDGQVPQVESDEYAEITNQGGSPTDLGGWRLNAGAEGQDFWFPSFQLQPGQSCRVYTNEHHPESCGFSFASGQALWKNSGDCGHLYDASGTEVSTFCY